MACRLLLIVALSLSIATPASAQEAPGDRLRGLFDDMIGAVNPYLADLAEMLGDLSGWHAPERLPNGDILIRRRHDMPEPREEQAPEEQVPGDQAPEGSEPVEDPFEL